MKDYGLERSGRGRSEERGFGKRTGWETAGTVKWTGRVKRPKLKTQDGGKRTGRVNRIGEEDRMGGEEEGNRKRE